MTRRQRVIAAALGFDVLLLAVLGGIGYVGYAGSTFLMHPKRLVPRELPAAYGLKPQPVELPTARAEGKLSGWFFKHADDNGKVVLFVHGFGSGKSHMLRPYLSWLAKRYTVLAFDLAGNGTSPDAPTTLGANEVGDVRSAVVWLKEHEYDKLCLLGTSMGGATAIDLAAKEPAVKAVVAEAAFAHPEDIMLPYYRRHGYPLPELFAWATIAAVGFRTGADMKDAAAVGQVGAIAPRPLLIIHGDADHVIPVADAHELYDHAGQPKQLWIVPGADHMSEATTSPHAKQPAEYEKRVEALFDAVK